MLQILLADECAWLHETAQVSVMSVPAAHDFSTSSDTFNAANRNVAFSVDSREAGIERPAARRHDIR